MIQYKTGQSTPHDNYTFLRQVFAPVWENINALMENPFVSLENESQTAVYELTFILEADYKVN